MRRRSASSTVVPTLRRHVAGRLVRGRLDGGRRRRRGRGQVGKADQVARAHDEGALQDVPELAHVSRPRVAAEDREGRLVDAPHGPPVALVELLEEHADQLLEILGALAERGQREREDRDAVVEVLAERAVLERLQRALVGGRDHPDVHRDLRLPPDPPEPSVLENPKELHLGGRAHLRDLVEEERPAVGELEAAGPASRGAGERALLVPEDLALEQGLRDRRAVHGDERSATAPGVVVDRARHQLLARSALTEHEDRRVGRCDLLDLAGDLLHRRRACDQAPEGAAVAELAPEPVDLAGALGPVERPLQENLEAGGVERLGEVVEGAFLHRLDGALDRALAREHDDGDVGVIDPQGGQEAETVHARHHEVAHHDRGRLLRHPLEGLGPVAGGGDLVSPEGEEVGHALPSEGIVLDDQYTLTHGNPALRAGLDGHGSRIGASGARALRLPSDRVGRERPCRGTRAGRAGPEGGSE